MGHERVVMITGATRGIGKAAARAFARRADRLVIVGRSTDRAPNRAGLPGTLESVESELVEIGADVLAIPADISQPDEVRHVVDATMDRFGRCDVLLNNAALSFLGPFVDVPARRWQPVLGVNLLAPVTLIDGFLPGMIERGHGRLLNVSSGAADTRQGDAGGVQQLPYSASKAALEALSFGLAAQLAGSGVAVNCVRPTVATEAVMFHSPHLLDEEPGRWARPEPYGEALVWLADQPATFSGQLLDNQDLRRLGALLDS